uniref:Uncharacterized protein n=1 Tax=Sphaerodactylus townsendi TaxID=933632 RepID=A0ACB8EG83_9SAUR
MLNTCAMYYSVTVCGRHAPALTAFFSAFVILFSALLVVSCMIISLHGSNLSNSSPLALFIYLLIIYIYKPPPPHHHHHTHNISGDSRQLCVRSLLLITLFRTM